jgi:hypothetical protein
MTIKLKQSNSKIVASINKALATEVNNKISKKINSLKNKLMTVFRSALEESPEIMSLRSGLLRAEFGLETDPSFEIVEAVLSTFKLTWQKINPKTFSGGITLVMQPRDFSNLLILPVGNQPIDGGSLPWLEWLLTKGDSIIITGYGVQLGNFPESRTGLAKMSKKFAPYKVNSSFSGTLEDNFITRAINASFFEVQEIIQGVFK